MDVRTLCLGALTLGDATGYQIRKMFEDGPFNHFLKASYGSIYPALTRLTEESLVTCQAEHQEKRPDKKIYSLTPKGRAVFADALLEPIAEDKFRSEFLFVMVFAHLLTPERVSSLIDDKLDEYRRMGERLDGESQMDTPAANFVKDFGRVVQQACVGFLQGNRHRVEAVAERPAADDRRERELARTR